MSFFLFEQAVAVAATMIVVVDMMVAGEDKVDMVVEIIGDHQCHMKTSLSQLKVRFAFFVLW